MNLLPIVFTCDDHYFKYAAVVISSIIHNSNRNTKYEINIVSEYISDENKALAQKMVQFKSNISLQFHVIKIENPEIFHLNSYMSLSTYYRFFIFDLLKEYERVLYLDSDLIIDNDISFFANIDFENKGAICCPSIYVQNLLKNNTKHPFSREYFTKILNMSDFDEYFNAGVILFNITLIRAQGMDRKFFEAIKNIKDPVFQDQDILNSVLSNNGGAKLISNEYNHTKTMKFSFKRIFFNALKNKFGKKRNNWFTIYHYVGRVKPWQNFNTDSALFLYYAYKTPFVREILKSNRLKLSSSLKIKLMVLSRF